MSADSELTLARLEREGLVSLPKNPGLDVQSLISSRRKLPKCASLLKALQDEREESLTRLEREAKLNPHETGNYSPPSGKY